MKWRVIPLEIHDAFMNMAIDESLNESVSSGAPATIRFYRWEPSAVSVGYFQSLREEVDIDLCREMGIDVVRRRTGGGTVYHDSKGEITYSLVAPEETYGFDIPRSYRVICQSIVHALALLDLPAEFRPVNDVVVKSKKISGSAQTRRAGILLQHGTLLYAVDLEAMFRLLKVGREKLSDKMLERASQGVTSITGELGLIDMQDVYQALLLGFTKDKTWEFGSLSEEELERAITLAEERYRSRKWNFAK